ncbi:pali-domain-containing protein [Metschnikowia bicuspidata]|uniref:Pali-domain-containing protein n=1 Tax=Metschnikowia bicuspidata TaxID=27322 RepID=A0A4P9ZBZ9_9ASCO|nr:pali-domain-containing protein [Metschnikowia bicuspidata]
MKTQRFAIFSSILLFVALVLLILATVSVPVTSSFTLAVTESARYGLLGYCAGLSCTGAQYPVLFADANDSATWLLGTFVRNTLAKVFVVCPVAAGFALITFVSSVVLVCFDTSVLKTVALIFNVLAAVASALVCVMVVLVFTPHVAWLGWLTVAAAACAALSFPLLFFSVGVHERDEDDVYGVGKNGFYAEKTTHESAPIFAASTTAARNYSTTGLDMGQASHDEHEYADTKQSGYTVRVESSVDSMVDAKPNVASDVAKVNSGITKYSASNSNGYHINDSPSTLVSAKRQMAPNYTASPVITCNTKPSAPYPPTERVLALYNPEKYGVFDHHPDVEGHQPFTELEDNDLPERVSDHEDRVLESDEESHFTSVSQRLPNEMYQGNQQSGPPFQQRYQGNYAPAMSPVNYADKPAAKSGSFASQSLQMAGSFPPQPQAPYQPPYQQYAPQQYSPQQYTPQYRQPPPNGYLQFQGPPNAELRLRPSVSENALNSNPDFALKVHNKRKGPRIMPPASRMGGPRNAYSGKGGY